MLPRESIRVFVTSKFRSDIFLSFKSIMLVVDKSTVNEIDQYRTSQSLPYRYGVPVPVPTTALRSTVGPAEHRSPGPTNLIKGDFIDGVPYRASK
jgi:hypothetical protein